MPSDVQRFISPSPPTDVFGVTNFCFSKDDYPWLVAGRPQRDTPSAPTTSNVLSS